MDTQPIEIDRAKALELYRAYKKHAHYSKPIDQEIQRTYQLIAQGKLVIRALDAIRDAGLNDDGLPKLAIVRADKPICYLRDIAHSPWMLPDRAVARFSPTDNWRATAQTITVPWPGFVLPKRRFSRVCHEAHAPLIPIHLRPKRGLQNYHILWEAEWGDHVPVDPLLLRRVGRGDLWLVVAAWDLTPVEQAALAARMHA